MSNVALDSSVCERLERQGTPRRYLAGTLTPEAAAAFEDHFLTCARCQRTLLRERSSWRVPRIIVAGASLAAAAVVALLLATPRDEQVALEPVDAPLYLGVDVRAASDHATALFDRAMARYNAAEYDAAARELQQALDAGAPVAPTAFFLGAALLLDGNARAAVDAFTRVIAAGPTPYLDEARFYRAHAYHRLREFDAARRDLAAIAPDHPLKPEAIQLSNRLGQ